MYCYVRDKKEDNLVPCTKKRMLCEDPFGVILGGRRDLFLYMARVTEMVSPVDEKQEAFLSKYDRSDILVIVVIADISKIAL